MNFLYAQSLYREARVRIGDYNCDFRWVLFILYKILSGKCFLYKVMPDNLYI